MLAATVPLAAAALLTEAVCGYPSWLYRRIGHPVTWMGRALQRLDQSLNRPSWPPSARRVVGVLTLLILLAATALAAAPFWLIATHPLGFVVAAVAAASLPAQRSLDAHVKAVADALDRGGLAAGRSAVAMIVGRNPAHLDEAAVARAAIESLAENFSDGVVAPALWLAVGGPVGGALYKAINTADSMIGHKTERHRAFGWAAARLDDLVNLPASRLSVVWIVLAALVTGGRVRAALRAVARDAAKHRSPNAGWPEAAVAGALGLALAGPRVYGDTAVDDAVMGSGRREATSADIRRALTLYRAACAIQAAVLLLACTVVG